MSNYNLKTPDRPAGLLQAVEKLMYWAQVSLPAVYGEELTYAKEQGKMAQKINEIVEQLNVNTEWTEYLLNEGVENETITYINELIANGTLGSLINNDLLGNINDEIVDTNNSLTALAGRVSQLEATGVPADSELLNIRVDATGKEWTSAGEAVRAIGRGEAFYPEAITQLLTNFWKKVNLLDSENYTLGTLGSNGEIISSNVSYVTDYTPVNPGDVYGPLPSTVWGVNIRMGTSIAFYKIDKTFLELVTINPPLNVTVPAEAAYCRISNLKTMENYSCIIKSEDIKYLSENCWFAKDPFSKHVYEYFESMLKDCHVERVNSFDNPTVTNGFYIANKFDGLSTATNDVFATAKYEVLPDQLFVGVWWSLTGNYTQSGLCIFLDENLNYIDNGYPIKYVEDTLQNNIAVIPIPRGAKYVYQFYRKTTGLIGYRFMKDDSFFKRLKEVQLNDESITLQNYFRVDNLMTLIPSSFTSPNYGSLAGYINNSGAGFLRTDFYPVNTGEVYRTTSNIPATSISMPLIITYDENKKPLRFIYSELETSLYANVEINSREKYITVNGRVANPTNISAKRQFEIAMAVDDYEVWRWTNDTQLNINQMVGSDGVMVASETYSSANVTIKPNTYYRVTDVGGGSLETLTTRVAFYDNNGNFISSINNENYRIGYTPIRWLDVKSPNNAVKMIVNFQNIFNTWTIKQAVRVYECIPTSAVYNNVGNYKNKYITYYGDSITYYGGWCNMLTNYFNWNGYVFGLSGATIAKTAVTSLSDNTNLNNMLSVKGDMVTLMGGVNDKGQLVPIGDIANIRKPIEELDKTKFVEAYAYIIKYIQTNSPETKIVIMTCTPSRADGFDKPTSIGLNSVDYSNAAKEVANFFGLKVVDVRSLNDFSEYTMPLLMMDNVHWLYGLDYMVAKNAIAELKGSAFMKNKEVQVRFLPNNLSRMCESGNFVKVVDGDKMVVVNPSKRV